MPLVEIQYKVGNSNPHKHNPAENWQDGMVRGVAPQGVFITPEDYDKWIKDDITPPGYEALAENQQDSHKRMMWKILYALSKPTLKDAMAICGMGERDTRARLSSTLEVYEKIHEHGGYDTNWGFLPTYTGGTLLAELTHQEAVDILIAPTNLNVHPFANRRVLRKSAYIIPYVDLLSKDSIDKIRDPKVRVIPPRNKASVIPFKFGECLRHLGRK